MMRWLITLIVLWISALMTGYLLTVMNSEGQEHPPISSEEVIKLLNFVGIPVESAIFVRRVQMGKLPQVPQDACFYRAKWQDVEWIIGVDTVTNRIVLLHGEAAFVPGGKPKRIRGYIDAVRLADVWFKRFGIEVEKTILWEVKRDQYRDIWIVSRERLLAPGIIVRVGSTLKLDGKSGGLVSFSLDPDLVVPLQLPTPAISSKEAIALALKQIAERPTEHYGPSKDTQLLDCYRFISWKRQTDGQLTTHLYWRIRFCGKAKRISHLPPEFQNLKPPKVVPLLWQVLVDAITGEVDIHWVSQQNELFTNGRLYRW